MKVVELSGGVGGARLARGLSQVEAVDLTIVVNVGDDEEIHGLHVSPDIDTVVYTLAGIEGPQGWGRAQETFAANETIGELGADNSFLLGDRDLAMNVLRTAALRAGQALSKFTGEVAARLGIDATVLPASDDRIRTMVELDTGEVLAFQDYFVIRGNRDVVARVEFVGDPVPAPGVIEAIGAADVLVIAPSNPPLSIWPILAIPGVREAVASHPRTVAVSPLFAGKAVKGPADRVMASLGLSPGNAGVLEAYDGLVDMLIVDGSDAGDVETLGGGVRVLAMDTRIAEPAAARTFAERMLAQ